MAIRIEKKHILAGGLATATVAAVAVFGVWWWYLPPALADQPIAFNHKLHLDKIQGVECWTCHQFVLSQTYAGLPSKTLCFDCHDPFVEEDDTEADAFKPEFATLMDFLEAEGDIPWLRATTMLDHVFFSHRRHTAGEEPGCERCHPKMPGRTSPPTRGPVMMDMDTCLACHEENDASVDCVACHR